MLLNIVALLRLFFLTFALLEDKEERKSIRQLSPNWIDANLIDAKVNIPFWKEKAMKTVEGTLNRIRIAKSQNPGIRVIYEFPKKEAAEKMNNWLNNNPGFIGIVEVRVRK